VDELFYQMVVRRIRLRYEKNPAMPTPLLAPEHLDVGHFELPPLPVQLSEHALTPDTYSVRLWSWAIYACDVVVMVAAYGIPAGVHFGGLPFIVGATTSSGVKYADRESNGPSINPSNDTYYTFMFSLVPWFMWMRSSLLSLFHAHVMIERALRDPDRTRCRLALLPARITIVVGLNLLLAHFISDVWERCAIEIGWQMDGDMWDGSPLTDCMMQVHRNASCVSDVYLARNATNPNYRHTYSYGAPESFDTWKELPYRPWGTNLDTPGWSSDASAPNFYEIPGID